MNAQDIINESNEELDKYELVDLNISRLIRSYCQEQSSELNTFVIILEK